MYIFGIFLTFICSWCDVLQDFVNLINVDVDVDMNMCYIENYWHCTNTISIENINDWRSVKRSDLRTRLRKSFIHCL